MCYGERELWFPWLFEFFFYFIKNYINIWKFTYVLLLEISFDWFDSACRHFLFFILLIIFFIDNHGCPSQHLVDTCTSTNPWSRRHATLYWHVYHDRRKTRWLRLELMLLENTSQTGLVELPIMIYFIINLVNDSNLIFIWGPHIYILMIIRTPLSRQP